MAVTTTTKTSVRVNVMTRSVVWVSNELMRTIIEVVAARDLPLDYVHRNYKKLINGFRTWIAVRALKSAIIEVFDPKTGKLVEKYPFTLCYKTETNDEESFLTDIDKLKAALKDLRRLHPGCQCRILVDLERDAPKIQGWVPSKLKDDRHLTRKDISGNIIDTAGIGVQMSCWIDEGSET